jgi:mono/diheme cytochrome c family protein
MVPALVLSACGSVSFSGEPEIISEVEVQTLPTARPTATPDPNATPAPTSDGTSDTSTIDLSSANYDEGFDIYVSQCASCHGASDGVGPGLASMRDTAPTRIEGMPPEEYVYQSIVDPGAFVVAGYANSMPTSYGTSLTAQQISSLIKFILEFDPSSMMGGNANADTSDDSGSDPSAADAAHAEATASSVTAGETSGETAGETISETIGETVTVAGTLMMGTDGSDPIPAGQQVELYALDAHGEFVGRFETVSTEESAFVFDDVPRAAGMVYLIQVLYDGVPQGAQITPINGDEETLTQDVTLYKRTTDTSNVAITWTEMLINYAPIDEFGLEVWLRIQVGNTGDQIVTTDEIAGPNDWYVSSRIELPVGAFGIQPMQSEGSARFEVEVVDGVPVVKDTWPLRPGQVQTITLAYYLPYENGAVIEQAFGYPIMAGEVLLPNDTVEFASSQFDEAGDWCCRVTQGGVRVTELEPDESIDPDQDFTLVKSHPLSEAVGTSDRLVFELIGRPTRTVDLIATNPNAVSSASGDGDTNTLPLLIGGFGVLLIGMAGVMWFMQRGQQRSQQRGQQRDQGQAHNRKAAPLRDTWQPPQARDKASLLKAITTLDDAYDAGLIETDVYEERRAILSDLLVPLLDEED